MTADRCLSPAVIANVAVTEVRNHALVALDPYQTLFPREVQKHLSGCGGCRGELLYAREVIRGIGERETGLAIRAARRSGSVPAMRSECLSFGVVQAIARLEARQRGLGFGRYPGHAYHLNDDCGRGCQRRMALALKTSEGEVEDRSYGAVMRSLP